MRHLFCVVLLLTLTSCDHAQGGFVVDNDPKSYFFPDDQIFGPAFILTGNRSVHSGIDPIRDEKSLNFLIIDKSIKPGFLLFEYKTDLITQLKNLGATLDHCEVSTTNEQGTRAGGRGYGNSNYDACLLEGEEDLVTDFQLDYSLGNSNGLVRVNLERRTEPSLITVYMLEYE